MRIMPMVRSSLESSSIAEFCSDAKHAVRLKCLLKLAWYGCAALGGQSTSTIRRWSVRAMILCSILEHG